MEATVSLTCQKDLQNARAHKFDGRFPAQTAAPLASCSHSHFWLAPLSVSSISIHRLSYHIRLIVANSCLYGFFVSGFQKSCIRPARGIFSEAPKLMQYVFKYGSICFMSSSAACASTCGDRSFGALPLIQSCRRAMPAADKLPTNGWFFTCDANPAPKSARRSWHSPKKLPAQPPITRTGNFPLIRFRVANAWPGTLRCPPHRWRRRAWHSRLRLRSLPCTTNAAFVHRVARGLLRVAHHFYFLPRPGKRPARCPGFR